MYATWSHCHFMQLTLGKAECCLGPKQVTVEVGLYVRQDELGMPFGLPHCCNPTIHIYPPSLSSFTSENPRECGFFRVPALKHPSPAIFLEGERRLVVSRNFLKISSFADSTNVATAVVMPFSFVAPFSRIARVSSSMLLIIADVKFSNNLNLIQAMVCVLLLI
jgi:hypothetical protein